MLADHAALVEQAGKHREDAADAATACAAEAGQHLHDRVAEIAEQARSLRQRSHQAGQPLAHAAEFRHRLLRRLADTGELRAELLQRLAGLLEDLAELLADILHRLLEHLRHLLGDVLVRRRHLLLVLGCNCLHLTGAAGRGGHDRIDAQLAGQVHAERAGPGGLQSCRRAVEMLGVALAEDVAVAHGFGLEGIPPQPLPRPFRPEYFGFR